MSEILKALDWCSKILKEKGKELESCQACKGIPSREASLAYYNKYKVVYWICDNCFRLKEESVANEIHQSKAEA